MEPPSCRFAKWFRPWWSAQSLLALVSRVVWFRPRPNAQVQVVVVRVCRRRVVSRVVSPAVSGESLSKFFPSGVARVEQVSVIKKVGGRGPTRVRSLHAPLRTRGPWRSNASPSFHRRSIDELRQTIRGVVASKYLVDLDITILDFLWDPK